MGHKELERDLKFIKRTMEAAGRYKNVPASGYLAAGILGALGAGLTWVFLGGEKLSNPKLMESADVWRLAILWSAVFVAAIAAILVLVKINARKLNLTAWNSLSARMFISQLPLLFVAGMITLGLVYRGAFELIPAVWLMCYSLMAYSFSYFTGPDHGVQGLIFTVLGAVAVFSSSAVSLILLAIGFGGVHIVFGVYRLVKPMQK